MWAVVLFVVFLFFANLPLFQRYQCEHGAHARSCMRVCVLMRVCARKHASVCVRLFGSLNVRVTVLFGSGCGWVGGWVRACVRACVRVCVCVCL